MNKTRRNAITKAVALLSEAHDKIEEAKTDLGSIREEEDEARENMPDSLREGEKGQAAEAAVDNLDSTDSFLDDAISALDDVISTLNDATASAESAAE